MPKVKASSSTKVQLFLVEFGDDIFDSHGCILFCKVCEVKVSAERLFTVQQVNTEEHKTVLVLTKNNNKFCQMLTEQNSVGSVHSHLQAFVLRTFL